MMEFQQQFEVAQLRQRNVVAMLESIAVFIFSLFVTAFLPQLLFKYFYADQQLLEQPVIFDYIQVGAFAVGVLYFFFSMASNIRRSMMAAKIEKQMAEEMMSGCCGNCDGNCSCDDEGCMCEDHGMEEMEEEVMETEAVKMIKKAGGKKRASKK